MPRSCGFLLVVGVFRLGLCYGWCYSLVVLHENVRVYVESVDSFP